MIAVASTRLGIEVRAPEEERAIRPALRKHLEAVDVPMPEEEDPLEDRHVPRENAHLNPRGLAALRAEDAGAAELEGNVAGSAFLNPMEPEPGVVDTESDGLDRGADRSISQRDAAGSRARISWMRRSSAPDFSGLA
jgi:hypothetical protein